MGTYIIQGSARERVAGSARLSRQSAREDASTLPPAASWGTLIQAGYSQIFAVAHPVLVPALAIAIPMLSFSFLGDGLRDALDSRMR